MKVEKAFAIYAFRGIGDVGKLVEVFLTYERAYTYALQQNKKDFRYNYLVREV